VAQEQSIPKKRDRLPPTLDISESSKASSGERTYKTDESSKPRAQQVIHPSTSRVYTLHSDILQSFQSHPTARYEAASLNDQLFDHPRSASATSSLDPYYFSVLSPTESPAFTLHDPHRRSKTPETRPLNEPSTPVKDPALIDRKGLLGLGELATPRWIHSGRNRKVNSHHASEINGIVTVNEDLSMANDQEEDEPDSPWTIEAIDGEVEDRDEVGSFHLF